MAEFVLVLGLIIAGVGVYGMALPGHMSGLAVRVRFTDGLRYLGVSLRIGIGVVLYLAADHTNFPVAIKVVAAFSVLAGVVLLFLDRDRLQRWLDGVRTWPPGALRGVCAFALAAGVLLIAAAV